MCRLNTKQKSIESTAGCAVNTMIAAPYPYPELFRMFHALGVDCNQDMSDATTPMPMRFFPSALGNAGEKDVILLSTLDIAEIMGHQDIINRLRVDELCQSQETGLCILPQ